MSVQTILNIGLIDDYKQSLGVEIIRQMLDLYIAQSAIYLEEIRSAASSSDHLLWHDKCHKMKGAASSIGFIVLRELLLSIEHSDAGEQVKLDYCAQLNQLNIEAITAFEAWITSS